MPGTFNYPNHKFSTKYPEGTRIKLGGGYDYTPEPSAPDQRIFSLKFESMRWFTYANGVVDRVSNATINLGHLENFYQQNRMHGEFTYPHPVYGNVICKFARPLEIPVGKSSGNGWVEGFEVELVEVP